MKNIVTSDQRSALVELCSGLQPGSCITVNAQQPPYGALEQAWRQADELGMTNHSVAAFHHPMGQSWLMIDCIQRRTNGLIMVQMVEKAPPWVPTKTYTKRTKQQMSILQIPTELLDRVKALLDSVVKEAAAQAKAAAQAEVDDNPPWADTKPEPTPEPVVKPARKSAKAKPANPEG